MTLGRVEGRLALCIALILGLGSAAGGQESARKALVEGVAEIAAPGLPGTVCAFGPNAFAVVVGPVSRKVVGAVAAAGKVGSGHAVVFGHTDYLDGALNTGDTGRLDVRGLCLREGVRRSLRDLPAWMPADFPTKS